MAWSERAVRPDAKVLSIGAVLSGLRDEFPGLSNSKLHFLEQQGLVEPTRTGAGYRKYSRDDVERLTTVLRLQRDRFWPLKVIRKHLIQVDETLRHEDAAASIGQATRLRASTAVRLDRENMCAAADVNETFLAELEGYGMLPRRGDWFDATDLETVRAANELAAAGIEPRHLGPVRAAVERQFHLVRSANASANSRDDPGARAAAHSAATETMEAVIRLHSTLLRQRMATDENQ